MATPNVLLCDQHSAIRAGEKYVLAGTVKIVGEASHGIESVTLATKLKPHIAIVGGQFPDLEGIVVARKILDFARGTRVIMLSGIDDPKTIDRAVSMHVHGYLTKHTDVGKLAEAVRVVAAGQEWFDDKVKEVLANYSNIPGFGQQDNTLSEREDEVICMWANGDSAKDTGEALGISEKTVARHRDSIRRKLKPWNRNRDVSQTDVTRYVIELGWIRGKDH
jgi:DNA-binding NarL/FixJ family response regulator